VSDHRVGWLFLAAELAVLAAGLAWWFGPVGLVAVGVVACTVGVLVVDWEAVSLGESARASHQSDRTT